MERVRIRSCARALLAAGVVVGAAAARAGAQQPQGLGAIAGRVTDRATGQPVESAQIRITGSTRGALTGDDGRYRIGGVPAGQVQLRAVRLGYTAGARTVTVTAGQTTTADFQMDAAATTIEAVTITATGETQLRRESGNSVATIRVDSLPLAPVNTFSDVLSSRTAGVTVQQSTGTTGGGSRIACRSPTTR
jgi:hypothetical protein